jgi:hypothetical protein
LALYLSGSRSLAAENMSVSKLARMGLPPILQRA